MDKQTSSLIGQHLLDRQASCLAA